MIISDRCEEEYYYVRKGNHRTENSCNGKMFGSLFQGKPLIENHQNIVKKNV